MLVIADESQRRKRLEHIRTLSPSNVILLSPEEVSDKLPPASKRATTSFVDNANVVNLDPDDEPIENANRLVSSTPFVSKGAKQVSFFSDIATNVKTNLLRKYGEPIISPNFEKLSPIAAEEEDDVLMPISENLNDIVIEKFASIASLEKKLENQFVPLPSSPTPIPSRSILNSSTAKRNSQQCIVVEVNDSMDIVPVKEIPFPRKRNSISNRTDANCVTIIETPVSGGKEKMTHKNIELNSELAERLKRCEVTLDETDDDSEIEELENMPPNEQSNNLSIPPTQDELFNELFPKQPEVQEVLIGPSQTLSQESSTNHELEEEAQSAQQVKSSNLEEKSPKEDQNISVSSIQSSMSKESTTKSLKKRVTKKSQTSKVGPKLRQKRIREKSASPARSVKSCAMTSQTTRKRIRVFSDSSEDDSASEAEHSGEVSQSSSKKAALTQTEESQKSQQQNKTVTEITNPDSTTSPTLAEEISQDSSQQSTQESTEAIKDGFLKPLTPESKESQASLQLNKDSISTQGNSQSESNTSLTRTVPAEVFKSMLSLRKLSTGGKEIEKGSSTDSLKINVPRKRGRPPLNVTAQTYLNLTNKKKEKKQRVSRKRTLYTLNASTSSVSKSTSAPSVEDSHPTEETEDASVEEAVVVQKKKKKMNVEKAQPTEVSQRNSKSSQSEDEEKSEDEETGDEINSESNSSANNIRYDPYEQGCQRPGLRVRRYMKPWWTNNINACNYGVSYACLDFMDSRAEVKLDTLKKKNILKSKFFSNGLDAFLKPSDKLKLVESQSMFLKGAAKANKIKSVPKKKKEAAVQDNDQDTEYNCSAITNLTSNTAFVSLASNIQSIFNGTSRRNTAKPPITVTACGNL